MPILSALFILGSLALCYAIPCKLIGTGQYDDENGVRQPQLHPFRGGPFDVIKSQDCYIRFQNPDNHPDYQKSKIDFAEAFRDCKLPSQRIEDNKANTGTSHSQGHASIVDSDEGEF